MSYIENQRVKKMHELVDLRGRMIDMLNVLNKIIDDTNRVHVHMIAQRNIQKRKRAVLEKDDRKVQGK